jgi:hypothetical protein
MGDRAAMPPTKTDAFTEMQGIGLYELLMEKTTFVSCSGA